MSYVRILVHAVWETKNRFPFLHDGVRSIMIDHIHSNARKKGIRISRINGMADHLHCLFYLNADLPIAKAIQLLKGESSFWINRQNLLKHEFEWGDEYYAVSVSESDKDSVDAYIINQQIHHQKMTFTQECEEFLRKYNLESEQNTQGQG